MWMRSDLSNKEILARNHLVFLPLKLIFTCFPIILREVSIIFTTTRDVIAIVTNLREGFSNYAISFFDED